MSADFTIVNHGTIFTFTPHTPAAKLFIDTYVDADANWMGNSLCVEHRYAQQLANGIAADGLVIA